MPRFLFKLAAVLTYRRHQRDLCRQLLAGAMADDATLVQQAQGVEQQRDLQFDEMRDLLATGRVNLDRSAARRYYAGQLARDLAEIEARRQLVAQQIARCREALMQADQRVKALEKLHANQLATFNFEQERRTARELEDNWLALHANDHASEGGPT